MSIKGKIYYKSVCSDIQKLYNTMIGTSSLSVKNFNRLQKIFNQDLTCLPKLEREQVNAILDKFNAQYNPQNPKVGKYFIQVTLLDCMFDSFQKAKGPIPDLIVKDVSRMHAEVCALYEAEIRKLVLTVDTYYTSIAELNFVLVCTVLLLSDWAKGQQNIFNLAGIFAMGVFTYSAYSDWPRKVTFDPPPELLKIKSTAIRTVEVKPDSGLNFTESLPVYRM